MKYAVKVGELYVHYIMLKEQDNLEMIQEVLLRSKFLRKFTKKEAEAIVDKIGGEILQEKND